MNYHICPTCLKTWRCWIYWCGLDVQEICPDCPDMEPKDHTKRIEVIANATQNNGK